MEVNPYQAPSADDSSFWHPAVTLPVTFDYHFGPDDMLCWFRFFYNNSPPGKRQRLRVIVFSTVVYLVAAFTFSLISRNWRFAIMFFGIAILASFMTPRRFDRRVEKGYKAHLDNAVFAGSFGPHQLTISDAGVRDASPAGETFVRWPYVIGASKEGDHVFIQTANGHATVLHRESLAGPLSFEEIVPFIGHLADQAKAGRNNPAGRESLPSARAT